MIRFNHRRPIMYVIAIFEGKRKETSSQSTNDGGQEEHYPSVLGGVRH